MCRTALHAHRHQDVERAFVASVLDHRRRARVGEQELHLVALDLPGDIQQIARIEADLERRRAVVDRRAPRWRCRLRGWSRTAPACPTDDLSFTARPRSLAMVDTRSTALMNCAFETTLDLSLDFGMTRAIVGECAVDQLRRQRDRPDLEPHLGGRHADFHGCRAALHQTMQLVHGLARDDDARHPFRALGPFQLDLRQAMPVRRHRAQRRSACRGSPYADRCR